MASWPPFADFAGWVGARALPLTAEVGDVASPAGPAGVEVVITGGSGQGRGKKARRRSSADLCRAVCADWESVTPEPGNSAMSQNWC